MPGLPFFSGETLSNEASKKNLVASCDSQQASVFIVNHVQQLNPAGAFLKPIEYSILSITIQQSFSMKKLLITLCIATVLFAACKEKQEPACPMVDAELVPAVVKDSLAARYPGVSVEVWYKVDAVGYCAKIQQAPNTIFAHFGIDGSFKEEERKDPSGKEVDGDDIQDENQNEDDSCECR